MELLLGSLALLAGVGVLFAGSDRRRAALGALACLLLVAAGVRFYRPGDDLELAAALPAERSDGGFTGSDACRACHPGQHHAWRGSFHRTMTQRATPAAVLGDFDGVVLRDQGLEWRLERRGDEFWAELPDPLWFLDPAPDKPATPPRFAARVVMTTGSHHQQKYWVRRPKQGPVHADAPDNGALVQLPWVWLVDAQRWIPTRDAFLAPPIAGVEMPAVWNSSCFACHSVATQPHFDAEEVTFATDSAELGIACEACHGPGAEHAAVNTQPWRRYLHYFGGEDEGDPTIVNPARLDHRRSAQVCGQCHSFFRTADMEAWQRTGTPYRAGDDLEATRTVFRWPIDRGDPLVQQELAADPGSFDGSFWPDGTIRVAGREYNGLLASACFQKGEIDCLSCHSMHGYLDASDQLAPDRTGDEACVECHAPIAERVSEHTHHAPASEGSRCINCHMPHTTYGLFTAMRSHRIDSPSAAVSHETGRPNACNLCHLDRTLEWTARRLAEWYGAPVPELDPRERSVSAALAAALEGDAAERAIAAWHMGWGPAQQASGRTWLGAPLAVLLVDPYIAVRRLAGDSIATLPSFADFAFDFAASPDGLQRQQREALARWQRLAAAGVDRSGPEVLLGDRGALDLARLRAILAERDDRPIRITE